MLELDGSMGEGGGQILRTSLALSLITGQAFRLRKIRAGRPKPGLHPQHLMSVRAAATIGQAKVDGDTIGSRALVFEPGEVKSGKYRFAIGTAGATGLVLHTIYLPLAWKADGPSELILEGGTHVSTSPCFHFLQTTWRAWMEWFGLHLKLKMNRTGFYPRGGGQVEAVIQSCQRIRGLMLTTREPLTRATGFSAVAGLPEHIAQRQARRARYRLRENGIETDIVEETWAGGPGSVLALIFDSAPVPTLFFGLGERGKPAEKVADEAVSPALHYAHSGEPVDPHSADQIVLPLALSEDASEFRVSEVTQHLITNIAVIRHFISRDIVCDGAQGSAGVVRIAAKG
ncbi:MAG TPA: RNA 3'-terminal phosphate cyclase [Gemmataceae bacterium]|nr:RNA 3'-terminal phosphate cyclase [Gemmataceae bacterium]